MNAVFVALLTTIATIAITNHDHWFGVIEPRSPTWGRSPYVALEASKLEKLSNLRLALPAVVGVIF